MIGAPNWNQETGQVAVYRGSKYRSLTLIAKRFGSSESLFGTNIVLVNFDGVDLPKIAVGLPGVAVMVNGTLQEHAGEVKLYRLGGPQLQVLQLVQT